jgi:hypothetical protein
VVSSQPHRRRDPSGHWRGLARGSIDLSRSDGSTDLRGDGGVLAADAYTIKHRGRVDLIAGVKGPSALKNSETLGTWVGNMAFAKAAIMAVAALLAWLVPSGYLLAVVLPTLILVFMVGIATAMGCQSRSETR